MSEKTPQSVQSQRNLWLELEPPLAKAFNTESAKDKPHPDAAYENNRRRRKSGPSVGGGRYRQKKKPARHPQASKPFSIRLTPAERARLKEDANGKPLGAYVKTVLFAPTTKAAARRAMIDHHKKLIAQVLAMIGSSGLADALTTMALAIHHGTFEDEEAIKATLKTCESELMQMRKALLKALGMRKT